MLVILAILIALLAPSLVGYIQRANDKAIISECRNAVVATQTELSEAYAKTPGDYSADIPDTIKAAAIALSEMPGEIVNAQADAKHLLLHLTYTRGDKTVVYCRDYQTCTAAGHEELYNIIDGDSGSGDPDDNNTYDGNFTIDGNKFQANGQLDYFHNQTTTQGVYYYNGKYYYLRGGYWAGDNIETYLENNTSSRNNIVIDIDGPVQPFVQGSQLKVGSVYLHNGEYYAFTPDTNSFVPGSYDWLTIDSHPAWFYKLTPAN